MLLEWPKAIAPASYPQGRGDRQLFDKFAPERAQTRGNEIERRRARSAD
jgi:hypothetical protein